MALATVSGTLRDFGGDLDLSVQPRIIFRPNGPAFRAAGLLHSKPIVVDTFGPGGSWEVELESTDELWASGGRDVWYDISIERLLNGADYTPWDYSGWRLRVPADGGTIGDLVDIVVGNDVVYAGPDAVREELRVGFQFNTLTNDLYERVVTF